MAEETHHRTPPAAVQLIVTASTPVELLQAGLRAVLDLVREGQPSVAATGAMAIPVRGLGPDLARLFEDLTADLISQLEEFGLGLDQIALDGLLQTETGGYTAWGYLSGVTGEGTAVNLVPIAGSVAIAPRADGLTLSCQVRIAAE